ncbi:hypothetical protein PILCRDRAFT_328243 [Piloderma croceum F 1598]|uniref:Uncharacterized protein n=1 Tax=Piloderma croceum (strain F 1598) TaxID=765440 RepID=A0A0C3G757_PILCF|nr:hypothetical protein PILCRDRAFT_328243 [Piloderma croceum F 1598]
MTAHHSFCVFCFRCWSHHAFYIVSWICLWHFVTKVNEQATTACEASLASI